MFSNNNLGAMCMAFPDVCKTPTADAVVPIPFPNIAISSTHIPSIFDCLVQFVSCNLLGTTGSVTMDCDLITSAVKDATSSSNVVKDIKSGIVSGLDTIFELQFPQPVGEAKYHHNGKATDFQCSTIGMRVSGTIGSQEVLCGAMPDASMLSVTGQNGSGSNSPGTTLTPSQVKVMVLS